jgi:hypothetical protein
MTSDSGIIYVYFFAALDDATDDFINSELDILRASLESLRACTHGQEVLLLTNKRFSAYVIQDGFSRIIIDDNISKGNLDFSRVTMQHRLAKELRDERGVINLCFVDHDVLFSADIEHFYSKTFDFGATVNFNDFLFDQHFLPLNTGIASVNAGVQLCKTSNECIAFLEKKIIYANWAEENRQSIPTPLNPSPYAWGCDQISMMLLFNRQIYQNNQKTFNIDDAIVTIFSTNILNYSPDINSSINLRQFNDHYIWHFKGQRKRFMVPFWEAIKNQNKSLSS